MYDLQIVQMISKLQVSAAVCTVDFPLLWFEDMPSIVCSMKIVTAEGYAEVFTKKMKCNAMYEKNIFVFVFVLIT